MASSYYRNFLSLELRRRQRQNPSYSLRAFAKFLSIESATLSRVLTNKESLSFKSAEKLLGILSADEKKKRLFLESLAKEKSDRRISKSLSEISDTKDTTIHNDQFQAISQWYHYAILELTLTKDFDPSPSAVGKTLGIDVIDAKSAIDRLIRLNLLKKIDGNLVKNNGHVTTADRSRTTEGLKEFSRTMLQMAAKSVDKCPFDGRAVFGMTMAIDPALIPVARQMMEQAAKEILSTLTSEKQLQVYQLQMALFPVQRVPVSLETSSRVLQ
ncbi:MAG: TIGR02147 family protein [Proteobacteria bacterium]|nr:TIGR02147 family protein [Pseudomonadota bacterium]